MAHLSADGPAVTAQSLGQRIALLPFPVPPAAEPRGAQTGPRTVLDQRLPVFAAVSVFSVNAK